MRRGLLLAVMMAVAALPCAGASPASMTATGTGLAAAWFSPRGVEAELEGALEFSFLGDTFHGAGHGVGSLELRTFSGWAWGVVWARTREGDEPVADLVGGLAVEGSPALGSGSVTGTCAFVLRRGGSRTEYRGTFVTQASSHLAPAVRPGTLSLEGEIAITFTLVPCVETAAHPWDAARWPPALLSELLLRFGE